MHVFAAVEVQFTPARAVAGHDEAYATVVATEIAHRSPYVLHASGLVERPEVRVVNAIAASNVYGYRRDVHSGQTYPVEEFGCGD